MKIAVQDGLLQLFDVEHGACALLTVPAYGGYRRMLIDCGHNASTGWTPGLHLSSLGINWIEELAVTNYDEDHVSGYGSLAANGIDYGCIWRNPSVTAHEIRSLKSETGIGPGMTKLINDLCQLSPRSTGALPIPSLDLPGVEIETFYNEFPDFDDENNLSLILHIRIHGWSFLFPGDMEREGFDRLIEKSAQFREVVRGLNVLIASHHGRASGICPAMFDLCGCRPELVVISDDYKRYDTQETVSYYARRCKGVENFRGTGNRRSVLTTRNDGEIIFTFQSGECFVK